MDRYRDSTRSASRRVRGSLYALAGRSARRTAGGSRGRRCRPLGAYVITDGPLFDLLAYPGDYEDSRLYGLITFVLAAVALGLMATAASMPIAVFVGTILLVGYGNLGAQLVRLRTDTDVVRVGGFCPRHSQPLSPDRRSPTSLTGDAVAQHCRWSSSWPPAVRSSPRSFATYSSPPTTRSSSLSVGLLLWLLAELEPTIGTGEIVIALAVTVAFGYASYALETASIAGCSPESCWGC